LSKTLPLPGMADRLLVSGKARRRRWPAAERWREYERRKADFLRDARDVSPGDYEQFIRRLGNKLGL
jgi:hypothetical protein